MRELELVINEMNFYAELFGEKMITFPLDIAEIEKVAEHISCGLSPENLTCDGAASPAHVSRQVNMLTTAQGELAMIFGEMIEDKG